MAAKMNTNHLIRHLAQWLIILVGFALSISAKSDDSAMMNPGWVGLSLSGQPCTGSSGGYGPYDYTNRSHRANKLKVVEAYHFNKEVESLIKGMTGSIGGDLDYTLRAFPNHHRALYAMMRYQLKTQRPANANYSAIECYFQRAMAFKPDDYRVMLLYANFLVKKDQSKMASRIYQRALTIDNAPLDINYALGLLYLDMKEFDKAVEQAKIVYSAGFKKTKLARKLKEVNRWPIK